MSAPTGILLAAGAARRFGGGKLAHPLPDGTPLGVAALRSLCAALDSVVVVIRSGDFELQDLFERESARIVACADAQLGMAHSLACAVAAAPDPTGWIVALADMPRVKPQTIAALADRLSSGAAIVVPQYRGQRGHPVAFAARFRDELLALSGDTGARELLARHAALVTRVEVDDPGILQDVDTVADLDKL